MTQEESLREATSGLTQALRIYSMSMLFAIDCTTDEFDEARGMIEESTEILSKEVFLLFAEIGGMIQEEREKNESTP